MKYNINKTNDLNYYLDNPNFVVRDVYGDKPSSLNYKNDIGNWVVSGYFKSQLLIDIILLYIFFLRKKYI